MLEVAYALGLSALVQWGPQGWLARLDVYISKADTSGGSVDQLLTRALHLSMCCTYKPASGLLPRSAP